MKNLTFNDHRRPSASVNCWNERKNSDFMSTWNSRRLFVRARFSLSDDNSLSWYPPMHLVGDFAPQTLGKTVTMLRSSPFGGSQLLIVSDF